LAFSLRLAFVALKAYTLKTKKKHFPLNLSLPAFQLLLYKKNTILPFNALGDLEQVPFFSLIFPHRQRFFVLPFSTPEEPFFRQILYGSRITCFSLCFCLSDLFFSS
jgi:hypothetical protein